MPLQDLFNQICGSDSLGVTLGELKKALSAELFSKFFDGAQYPFFVEGIDTLEAKYTGQTIITFEQFENLFTCFMPETQPYAATSAFLAQFDLDQKKVAYSELKARWHALQENLETTTRTLDLKGQNEAELRGSYELLHLELVERDELIRALQKRLRQNEKALASMTVGDTSGPSAHKTSEPVPLTPRRNKDEDLDQSVEYQRLEELSVSLASDLEKAEELRQHDLARAQESIGLLHSTIKSLSEELESLKFCQTKCDELEQRNDYLASKNEELEELAKTLQVTLPPVASDLPSVLTETNFTTIVEQHEKQTAELKLTYEGKIRDLEANLSHASSSNQAIKNKASRETAELHEQQVRVKELGTRIQELEATLSRVQDDNRQLMVSKLHAVNVHKLEATKTIAKLTEQCNSLVLQNSVQGHTINNLKEQLLEQGHEMSLCRASISSLESKHSAASRQLESASMKLKESELQLANMSEQNSSLGLESGKKLRDAEALVSDLKLKLLSQEILVQDYVRQLEQANALMEKQRVMMKSFTAQSSSANEALCAELYAAQDRILSLTEAQRKLELELLSVKNNDSISSSRVAMLEKEILALKDEIIRASAQLKLRDEELKILSQQALDSEKANAHSQKQLEDALRLVHDANAHAASQQAVCADLQKKSVMDRKELIELKEQTNELTQSNHVLATQNADLLAEVKALQGSINALQASVARHLAVQNDLNMKNRDLRTENLRLLQTTHHSVPSLEHKPQQVVPIREHSLLQNQLLRVIASRDKLETELKAQRQTMAKAAIEAKFHHMYRDVEPATPRMSLSNSSSSSSLKLSQPSLNNAQPAPEATSPSLKHFMLAKTASLPRNTRLMRQASFDGSDTSSTITIRSTNTQSTLPATNPSHLSRRSLSSGNDLAPIPQNLYARHHAMQTSRDQSLNDSSTFSRQSSTTSMHLGSNRSLDHANMNPLPSSHDEARLMRTSSSRLHDRNHSNGTDVSNSSLLSMTNSDHAGSPLSYSSSLSLRSTPDLSSTPPPVRSPNVHPSTTSENGFFVTVCLNSSAKRIGLEGTYLMDISPTRITLYDSSSRQSTCSWDLPSLIKLGKEGGLFMFETDSHVKWRGAYYFAAREGEIDKICAVISSYKDCCTAL